MGDNYCEFYGVARHRETVCLCSTTKVACHEFPETAVLSIRLTMKFILLASRVGCGQWQTCQLLSER